MTRTLAPILLWLVACTGSSGPATDASASSTTTLFTADALPVHGLNGETGRPTALEFGELLLDRDCVVLKSLDGVSATAWPEGWNRSDGGVESQERTIRFGDPVELSGGYTGLTSPALEETQFPRGCPLDKPVWLVTAVVAP